jgi:sec-independent protein translocase protein TatA
VNSLRIAVFGPDPLGRRARHRPTAGAPLVLVFGLGLGELLLIVGLLVLLFGARKIPLLARGLGEGIRNFKGSLKEGRDGEPPEDGDDGSR